jgi:hypothetical protein
MVHDIALIKYVAESVAGELSPCSATELPHNHHHIALLLHRHDSIELSRHCHLSSSLCLPSRSELYLNLRLLGLPAEALSTALIFNFDSVVVLYCLWNVSFVQCPS